MSNISRFRKVLLEVVS